MTLFVGGADDAVARASPVLAAYGDPVLHVGALGAGQQVKLINNTLFAAQIGLLRRGGRGSAAALGVDEAALLAALTARQRRRAGRWAISRGRARPRHSSPPSANSSARTSRWSAQTVAELGSDLGALDDVVDAGLGRESRRNRLFQTFSDDDILLALQFHSLP